MVKDDSLKKYELWKIDKKHFLKVLSQFENPFRVLHKFFWCCFYSLCSRVLMGSKNRPSFALCIPCKSRLHILFRCSIFWIFILMLLSTKIQLTYCPFHIQYHLHELHSYYTPVLYYLSFRHKECTSCEGSIHQILWSFVS